MKYTIRKTEEYDAWYDQQPCKVQFQIYTRLFNIAVHGHFGNHRYLDDIWELKWNDGRRIYYAHFKESNVVLLLGVFKNDQKKDIRYAKKIFKACAIKAFTEIKF